MTNKELRQALLNKLGITHQALSLRVKKVQAKIPLSTEEAVYLIAHNEGIIISKYLDKEEVGRIRSIHNQHKNMGPNEVAANPLKSNTKIKQKETRVFLISSEFRETDPVLSGKTLNEAKEMASIFPLLYVLENSIREVTKKLMEKYFGEKWWDSQASRQLKDKIKDRMDDEKRNSWHQKRGASEIYYLDLNELPSLWAKLAPKSCPSILPSLEWINGLITEVYKSRCVICHMNPLDKDSIASVKLRYKQWQKQIAAKKSEIIPV
jgi:hypothetical protein